MVLLNMAAMASMASVATRVRRMTGELPTCPVVLLLPPVLWDLAYSATAINVPVALLKMTL